MFVFEDFVTCDRPFCAQVRSRTMPDRSTIVMMLMLMMSSRPPAAEMVVGIAPWHSRGARHARWDADK